MIKPSITGNKLALSLEPHRDSGGYSTQQYRAYGAATGSSPSYSPIRPYKAV